MDRHRHFDALGFTFTVDADHPGLVAYLDHLLRALRQSGPGEHHYELLHVGADDDGAYGLSLDGDLILGGHPAARLVTPLIQDINRRAVDACAHVTIHAGGVEHDGAGLVFPGGIAAGKTTLVAGLLQTGFGYLTDEAVAVDRDTLLIRPYPKPLSLDPGSWPLFPDLEPHADLATDDYKSTQWQVPVNAIAPGLLGQPCPLRVVVFPQLEVGAESKLEPIGRAEALVELAGHTFRFGDRSRDALDVLADAVRAATCYRLTVGRLEDAVALVVRVAHGAPADFGHATRLSPRSQ
jgi:hypothetical protein